MKTTRRLARFLVAAVLATTAAAAEEAGQWKLDGFSLKNKQADFRLSLTGYVQLDARDYVGWTTADPETKPLNDSLDVRRVRSGFEIEWKNLAVEFDLDWTGDLRKLVDDANVATDAAEIKDLYAEYRFSKAFSLRAGTFKLPVGPEFLTSAGKTDFVERSMLASSLGPDRDWGVIALGEVAERLEYEVGVFAGDGRVAETQAGTTLGARLVWKATSDLDVGGSFAYGDVEPAPDGAGTDPDPKGFSGRSPTDFRFYDRKFVSGRRLRWGLDAAYTRGPLGFKAEWLQAREEREGQGSTLGDLPTHVADGWSVTASWIVTGEKKARTLKPARSVFGGPGLVELAARYEQIRFDDAGPNEGFEGAGNRARNIRPGGDRAFWAGVSWLPTPFVRLLANVVWETYRDPLLAPEPTGARGLDHEPAGAGSYVSFLARIQFQIP